MNLKNIPRSVDLALPKNVGFMFAYYITFLS